jgi:hypothetical protein
VVVSGYVTLDSIAPSLLEYILLAYKGVELDN